MQQLSVIQLKPAMMYDIPSEPRRAAYTPVEHPTAMNFLSSLAVENNEYSDCAIKQRPSLKGTALVILPDKRTFELATTLGPIIRKNPSVNVCG